MAEYSIIKYYNNGKMQHGSYYGNKFFQAIFNYIKIKFFRFEYDGWNDIEFRIK